MAKFDVTANLNELLSFIPVSDMEAYQDFESSNGYGGMDQIPFDDGILVLKSDEERFRKNVKTFEERFGSDED